MGSAVGKLGQAGPAGYGSPPAAGVDHAGPPQPAQGAAAGWGLAILACGAASVIVGAVAIIRRHERSRTLLLATVVGLLVTALMLSEVAQGLSSSSL